MCKCALDIGFFEDPLQAAIVDEPTVEERTSNLGSGIPVEVCMICFVSALFRPSPLQHYEHPGVASIFTNEPSASGVQMATIDSWSSHSWSYILLALCSIFLLCALCVLTLVAYKLFRRVITGNQSLGITLLLSVIAIYGKCSYSLRGRNTFCSHGLSIHLRRDSADVQSALYLSSARLRCLLRHDDREGIAVDE